MRILISGPPPWAESGYGVQAGLAAKALRQLGHRVAISAYAGIHREHEWHGIQILSTGGKPYGNGVTAGNYARWNADLLIFICDPWTIDPGQLGGLHVMAWMPVDVERLSIMEARWLDRLRQAAASIRPVAMSRHGQDCLEAAGWPAPLVPHAAVGFGPSPGPGRDWRRSIGISETDFLITKIGVNNEDDRKAFEVTLLAFAQFAARHANVRLYLHTEAQAKGAPNLAMMALDLGLKGKIAFAHEHKRGADLYTPGDMRDIYNGTDVLDAATKGEGFSVCIIEALACGTPVIGCRNSAVTEKIRPEFGWLIGGQRTWARHHNSWWRQPSVLELARAYEQARASARTMRRAAAAEGARWSLDTMIEAWTRALEFPARPADHAEVFRAVYASGQWGQGSGPGSDPEAAKPYIKLLEDSYLDKPMRVLDLGCGDGRLSNAIYWRSSFYTGLDVMTGHDIRTCELPDADLVLIKDVFQHWSNADIAAMLPRLARFPVVLITNTIEEKITGRDTNADIAAGEWRGLDLAAEPFGWPVREVLRWEIPGEIKSVVELSPPARA